MDKSYYEGRFEIIIGAVTELRVIFHLSRHNGFSLDRVLICIYTTRIDSKIHYVTFV